MTDLSSKPWVTVRQRHLVGALQADMGELEELLDDEGAIGSAVTERPAIIMASLMPEGGSDRKWDASPAGAVNMQCIIPASANE